MFIVKYGDFDDFRAISFTNAPSYNTYRISIFGNNTRYVLCETAKSQNTNRVNRVENTKILRLLKTLSQMTHRAKFMDICIQSDIMKKTKRAICARSIYERF